MEIKKIKLNNGMELIVSNQFNRLDEIVRTLNLSINEYDEIVKSDYSNSLQKTIKSNTYKTIDEIDSSYLEIMDDQIAKSVFIQVDEFNNFSIDSMSIIHTLENMFMI
ncbi:MAG: hypothetical protein ACRC23_02115 [Aeromonas jandaei]